MNLAKRLGLGAPLDLESFRATERLLEELERAKVPLDGCRAALFENMIEMDWMAVKEAPTSMETYLNVTSDGAFVVSDHRYRRRITSKDPAEVAAFIKKTREMYVEAAK